jgi:hypothetical protein
LHFVCNAVAKAGCLKVSEPKVAEIDKLILINFLSVLISDSSTLQLANTLTIQGRSKYEVNKILMKNRTIRIICTGLLAGFVSEGILGLLFTNPLVRSILYNPGLQSPQFLVVTSSRVVPLPLTIAGLIILSIIHAWLFAKFQPAVPGSTWVRKGLFWGFTIWLMYWVFQEWFIYMTLLGEPIPLVALELTLLLTGSLVEGLIISRLLHQPANICVPEVGER